MNADHDTVLRSPSGKHEARLRYVDEVRFGPPYFELLLDGRLLGKRVFGSEALWSPDSRWLAVEEWMTVSESEGPKTVLVVFDLANSRQTRVFQANGGFLKPDRFVGSHVFSRATWYRAGVVCEFDHVLPDEGDPAWQAIP